MTLLSRRPPTYNARDGIAYTYARRADGRYVVLRTWGGATTAYSSYAKESAARRAAEDMANVDRAMR